MLFPALHTVLVGVTLSCGALTSFTDRGKTDFDTALQILNPYGRWSKIESTWCYTPFDREAPYVHGRWLYTEYGWYWQGARAHSWATEHYGFWKLHEGTWSWYPGPYWLPEIVELRATSTHVGWRCAAVNREGAFVEKPEERYLKTGEWTFVTLRQFASPILPGQTTAAEQTQQLLEDSSDSRHTYVTYREIDRPGPHPADFLGLGVDRGMFAPQTLHDLLAAQAASPAVPGPARPFLTQVKSVAKSPLPAPGPLAPTGLASTPAATGTAATLAPTAAEQATADAAAEDARNRRQVKYWVTMSLPTYWTARPLNAEPTQLYLYRPDFYQDEDGISRRVELWVDPEARKKSSLNLHDVLAGGHSPVPAKTGTPLTGPVAPLAPGIPAQPAIVEEPALPKRDPFRSPFAERPSTKRAKPIEAAAPPASPH